MTPVRQEAAQRCFNDEGQKAISARETSAALHHAQLVSSAGLLLENAMQCARTRFFETSFELLVALTISFEGKHITV